MLEHQRLIRTCDHAIDALPDADTHPPVRARKILSSGQTRACVWTTHPSTCSSDHHFSTTWPRAGFAPSPFAQTQIPVLDCTCLAVFKAFFNRTRTGLVWRRWPRPGNWTWMLWQSFLADLLGGGSRFGQLRPPRGRASGRAAPRSDEPSPSPIRWRFLGDRPRRALGIPGLVATPAQERGTSSSPM